MAKKKVANKSSTKNPQTKPVKVVSADNQQLNNGSPFENEDYRGYVEQLNKLREDGENKIIALRSEIRDIWLNKQLDKETRKKLIQQNMKQLKIAKADAKKHRKEVKGLIRHADKKAKREFKRYFSYAKAKKTHEIKQAKLFYRDITARLKRWHANRVEQIKAQKHADKKALAVDLKAENISYSAKLNEARVARNESITNAKLDRYNAFMNKYGYSAKIKNDKHSPSEWLRFKFENYIAHFNGTEWLIRNVIYIVVLVLFVTLVIISALKGNSLLTGDNILIALVQIAPKIFFALGVGGLILLGGTDLSIGRLTGVGVAFTLMILSSNTTYADNSGIVWFNLTSTPLGVRILCALLISILLCTAFTAFAGFFTAKFKMHPFISTLAVQLISFGLFQLFWSATASFTPDKTLDVDPIRGPNGVYLIIYALIAIAVVWFIWNKTKFGKHIYAVGGNQEAATVSGIDPFKITLLAFVMAGILYGFGGFCQALQTGTGNFNSGYGTETDAIAACVIGGISFSGGVGKVSGAVLGAVILGFLTHAFNNLSIDANLQLLIKGVIILLAVTLDCVKYLKKK